jgi:hypothetical protein
MPIASAAPVGIPPMNGMPSQIEHQYHVGINGAQFGPYVAQQLAQMLMAGQIASQGTKVWRIGLPTWVELNQLAELALLLQSPPPLPAAMPPPLL